MLANLGTVFLLGLITISGSNDLANQYNYHAVVQNDTVVKSAYIYLETDDDEYNFYLDLSFSCDFYYSQGSDDYIINNVQFDTTINRHQIYTNQLINSYSVSVIHSGSYHIYELDNNVYKFEWSFIHEDDTCHFKWYSASNSLIDEDNVVVLPNEEFVTDSSISINVDTSQFYQQLLDFGNYAKGYDTGYQAGYGNGYAEGNSDGQSAGYQIGYSDGYQEASDQNSTAVTIFTGICEVGLLPVNVFLGILNFEVFGINIGGFVASLMTIAIVVIVLRVVLGAKSKDD